MGALGHALMAFVANPLSLSIPPATFETWLRDSGYLEILDKCAIDPARSRGGGIVSSIFSFIVNPFGNLTVEDVCRQPVAWTGEFWDCGSGLSQSYGWPLSGTQLKLRMAENRKRYMGNYLRLFVFIFACFVYKMPVALLGIISVLVLWDTLRMLSRSLQLESDNFFHQCFLLFGKIATAVLMVYCKIAQAVCWAGLFSFAVVIIHGSLRKITPSKGRLKPEQKQ